VRSGALRPPGILPLLLLGGLLLGLAPSRLSAQDEPLPPEFLREHALVVHFLAAAFDPTAAPAPPGARASPAPAQTSAPSVKTPTWTSNSLRYTMSGSPVAIRLAGVDLVVVIQITPYDHGTDGLVLLAQGQVWKRSAIGSIDYRNVFETLTVAWGERVFFFPLGVKADGSTAMSLEISVDRFSDGASSAAPTPAVPLDAEAGRNPLPAPGADSAAKGKH